MSKANIPYNKICLYCHSEFVAQKRTTKYCSHKCNQRAYKQSKREDSHRHVTETELVKSSNIKTNLLLEEIAESVKAIKTQIQVAHKPYLSLKEASVLLNVSKASIYRLTEKGIIPTYDIGLDKRFVKRMDIDSLFQSPKTKEA